MIFSDTFTSKPCKIIFGKKALQYSKAGLSQSNQICYGLHDAKLNVSLQNEVSVVFVFQKQMWPLFLGHISGQSMYYFENVRNENHDKLRNKSLAKKTLCFENYFCFLFACAPPRREGNSRVNSVEFIQEKRLDLTKQRKSFTEQAQSGKYCKYCAFIR